MEKFDLENFPMSESAKKMLGYVSDGFYDESYVGKWIFQVMGIEYDKALEIVTDLPVQFFPETATWGLMYHEIKWGLPVRENLPYKERRRRIYQKRDYKAPMTPHHMEQYISSVTGFEVYIADVHDMGYTAYKPEHPNCFLLIIRENENTIIDYKSVESLVNKIKQSHTTFEVEHRQEFEGSIQTYVGAVVTELVEYEVKSRPISRNVERSTTLVATVLIDNLIIEEIQAERVGLAKEDQNG